MNKSPHAPLKDSRIYVAGHRGLAGSAILRRLKEEGCREVIVRSHAELDLTDSVQVRQFFAEQRPEYVFLAAAKVGGILANSTKPAEFILANLQIQTNIIEEAYRTEVKRLLFLGSSCIYPREAPQPIAEESLLSGPLESTNRAYAVAKIAGIEMCAAFNQQYGTHFLPGMPTNLYGPNDNYHPQDSHVLPALIRRFHHAKQSGDPEVVVWGTGKVRREFLHSDDMADACCFLMSLPDAGFQRLLDFAPPIINIGAGKDITIAELAELVKEVVGFSGRIVYDASKPDGTPRKLLDTSRLSSLGWQPKISFREGLSRTYRDFQQEALQHIASVATS